MSAFPKTVVFRFVPTLLSVVAVVAFVGCTLLRAPSGTLPERLSDEAFWQLMVDLSEPPGVFTHSDNLVSNESFLVHTVRQLRARGGVYIGVGPEQNFSYIARLAPAMAFVIDIRRENRNLHLLYKVLFEASADRIGFVSRLFSRDLPRRAGQDASVDDLFDALSRTASSATLRAATGQLVRDRLIAAHKWFLTPEDLSSIDYALDAFASDGPGIHYSRLRPDSERGPSYRALMTSRDVGGLPRSYLASDEAFAIVKELHARNLVVPVVGDFGRAGALVRVSEYVQRHGSSVSAFYGSNVEVYLTNQQRVTFCNSLASLPAGTLTWFIGGRGAVPLSSKLRTCPRVAQSIEWRPPTG
jgi:hypothetical protein